MSVRCILDGQLPTANEIGARPNTWLPTPEEIGARPDTWTPTAAEVGARPDTWIPQLSEIGDSNFNLIDNGYFGNPVNSRNMETYNGVGWTIDRWLNRSTNLIVKIIKGENLLLDNSNGDIPGYLRQYFSDNYILKGKKYVLSILIDEVSGTPNQYGYYGYISETLENGSLSSKGISKADLHSLQSTLSSNMTGVQIQVEAGCTMKI